jgi:hypothetical protein
MKSNGGLWRDIAYDIRREELVLMNADSRSMSLQELLDCVSKFYCDKETDSFHDWCLDWHRMALKARFAKCEILRRDRERQC